MRDHKIIEIWSYIDILFKIRGPKPTESGIHVLPLGQSVDWIFE